MANPSRGGDAKPRVRKKYSEIAGLPKEKIKKPFGLAGFFIERVRIC